MLHFLCCSKKAVDDILASGHLCILDVEINGVKNIKSAALTPVPRFIFVKPPSMETLVCMCVCEFVGFKVIPLHWLAVSLSLPP